ncbi:MULTISPECIES: DUF2306 domain-containing protein [Cyclobacterium]|uniref:Membrane protein n=1 Tax=Cyclobacterium amurskyense TaxID=320787 RepID=A0A0H4PIF8_9BACT|nr:MULTISPECIES: hypothetical protein [Cyclobacterium]AKP52698.1 membrane protein [Cyclobacterium amurskyense]MBI0400412.1 hypothetical protein [Cyclobacterium marinum]|tara:strand:- start:735 stop:1214 length:480 start_codon:yes stop_codon:yes gene_type:complete
MENLVGDTTGLIHLISSSSALLFGTLVLMLKKGTKLHVKMGYLYLISMGVLILTALMIYRLFNGWGIFHFATLFSLLTIILGMIPVWTKKPLNTWKFRHFTFMYWSVIGLYSAFGAEILTRIPKSPFFGMVGLATVLILFFGAIFFRKNRRKWIKVFGS